MASDAMTGDLRRLADVLEMTTLDLTGAMACRAAADRIDRAAALEAGLRELEAELRREAGFGDPNGSAWGRGSRAGKAYSADRIAALLAEHGSEQ